MASSMLDSPLGESGEEEGRMVYVSRDFYATMDTQLSVFCDDELQLLSDSDKYWWLVREQTSGQTGYVPSDIVESLDEHVAKMNRLKNQELTRPTSNDLPWRTPTNESDESLASQTDTLTRSFLKDAPKPWSASGFARKSMSLRSAPAVSRHKKTVSFSEKQPEEHRFAVEDDSATEASAGDGMEPEDDDDELREDAAEHGRRDRTRGSEREPPMTPDSETYDYNVDPIVDELLEREFGTPLDPLHSFKETSSSSLSLSSSLVSASAAAAAAFTSSPMRALQPEAQSNGPLYRPADFAHEVVPVMEKKGKRTDKKEPPRPNDLGPGVPANRSPQKLKSLVSRLWRVAARPTRTSAAAHAHKQLLRIYAGNFSAVHGYKTLLLDEETPMAEVAEMAVDKFGLQGDRFNYMLSVVHCETHEILHVSANYTLAMVIELAKRATLMEGEFVPVTDSSLAALPRRVKKRQSKALCTSKSVATTPVLPSKGEVWHETLSFSCLASPVVQALAELDLARDRTSDFVTHYKFVLNRWLESPAPTTPFYLKVQLMISSNTSRSNNGVPGILPAGAATKRPKSPLSGPLPASAGVGGTASAALALPPMQDEAKVQSGTKMLVNTSMTVAELTRAALSTLDISSHTPGITYDLYLACRMADIRDRIYLTKEMVVADILHLRPMIDPSGLTLVLQPIVDSKSRS